MNSRAATTEEIKEHDRRHPPVVPGGGSTRSTPATAPGNGHDPTGIAEALNRALADTCRTARNESAVLKALAKAVPASTPLDRKAAVNGALAAKTLGEVDGKLLWAPDELPEDDAPPWEHDEPAPEPH